MPKWRMLPCAFKGECDDPRCKQSLCVLEEEEKSRLSAAIDIQNEDIQAEAIVLARSVLALKGVRKPKEAIVRKAAALPQIRQAAKERLQALRALTRRNSN